MNTYACRLISTGKKGKAQVTVACGNKVVTRHLLKGIGKHPDDSLPATYATFERRLHDLSQGLKAINEHILASEAALLDPSFNLKNKSILAKALPSMRAYVLTVPDELHATKAAFETLKREHPLLVRYIL